MQRPLEGIRVLKLSIWIRGPLAGMQLAGLGAEVIKLEKPIQGDFSRGIRSAWGAAMSDKTGRSIFWEAANRGKKDISLDLKMPEGREILHRLVDRSDVFLTNLSFEALRAFGADRETVTARNPGIMFAQATIAGPNRGESHRRHPDRDRQHRRRLRRAAKYEVMERFKRRASGPPPCRGWAIGCSAIRSSGTAAPSPLGSIIRTMASSPPKD